MPTRDVQMIATLQDSDGNPLPNKTIEFYYKESRATEWTLLGTATTDTNGQATYTATLTVPGDYDFRAVFPGDPDYESAEATLTNQHIKAKTVLTLTIQPM